MAVEVLDVARLAEVVDAQARDRRAADRGEEGQRVRMAVEHGDDRRRALGREQLVEDRVVAVGEALPRLQRAEHEIGRGQADDVARRRPPPVELVGGGEHLGHDRADADERHRRRALGARAAGSRPRAPAAGARSRSSRLLGQRRQRLVDRPRGEAEIGRAAVGRARAATSACSSVHSRSWPNAGSQAMQRGCSSPTDGVMIDWCAPPSGASVTPDGVPTRIDWPPA